VRRINTMKIARRPNHQDVQFSQTLTQVTLGLGLGEVDDLRDELLDYTDVLLGREQPPINSPYLNLAEVATAYYCRAREIEMLIYEAEREGAVLRGMPHYRFRNGALASFIELSKKMADLGSRRLTQEQLLQSMREIDS
jgi:hypothetical protein